MNTRKISYVLFLIIMLALSGVSSALADIAGRFTIVEGKVDILRPGQTRAVSVKKDDAVSPGDIVRTKSDSFAEITFKDNATLKLAQNTRIEIKDYQFGENDKRKSGTLRLLRGKVRATVPKTLGRVIPIATGPSTFQVQTPTAVAGVRGTDFLVYYDLGSTGVFVMDGAVDAFNINFPDNVLRVRGGFYTIISAESPAEAVSRMQDFVKVNHLNDTSGNHGNGAAGLERVAFDSPVNNGGNTPFMEQPALNNLNDRLLELPVSEVHTALLNTSVTALDTFSGHMSGADVASTYYLTVSGTLQGDWKDNGNWGMELQGSYTNLLPGTGFVWQGSIVAVDTSGSVLGTISNGHWMTSGAWTADVSGTKTDGNFNGTISGTYTLDAESSTTGTFTGTGSGTWATGLMD